MHNFEIETLMMPFSQQLNLRDLLVLVCKPRCSISLREYAAVKFGNVVIDKTIANGNDVIANVVAPANISYCGKRRRK